MLTCKDASRLVSERQERSLRFGERWGLRLHLWICVHCRRFEQQLRLLRMALRRLARTEAAVSLSSGLSPEARERIRQALAGRDA